MAKNESKVQINYKSGQSMVFTVEDFTARRVGGELREVEWATGGQGASPLFIGLDDIESIWEL